MGIWSFFFQTLMGAIGQHLLIQGRCLSKDSDQRNPAYAASGCSSQFDQLSGPAAVEKASPGVISKTREAAKIINAVFPVSTANDSSIKPPGSLCVGARRFDSPAL